MIIERDKQDIVIRLDSTLIDIDDVQRFVDYFKIIESTAKNKGNEEEVEELTRESQKGWWKENRHRFIK